MVHALSIVLVAAVAISIAANAYLYESSQSLQTAVSALNSENQRLTKQLGAVLHENSSSTAPANATVQKPSIAPGTSALSNETGTVHSITAVAVKAVQQSDGFFQNVAYEGTVMGIAADIRPGEGRILINTQVPTGVDFQSSAKTAVKVAESITGVQLSSRDVIFSITSMGNATDLQAVDGGSAGGAMTVLLVSELEGKQINPKVLMTGTINADGTIGPIGGVEEKAQAAGQYGAKTFLVPNGQAVYADQVCHQNTVGPVTYTTCQAEQKSLSDLTQSKYGMKVVEVGTIQDALAYFIS